MRGGEWIEIDLGVVRSVAMLRWLPRVYEEAPVGLILDAATGTRGVAPPPRPAGVPGAHSTGREGDRWAGSGAGASSSACPPTPARYLRISQTGCGLARALVDLGALRPRTGPLGSAAARSVALRHRPRGRSCTSRASVASTPTTGGATPQHWPTAGCGCSPPISTSTPTAGMVPARSSDPVRRVDTGDGRPRRAGRRRGACARRRRGGACPSRRQPLGDLVLFRAETAAPLTGRLARSISRAFSRSLPRFTPTGRGERWFRTVSARRAGRRDGRRRPADWLRVDLRASTSPSVRCASSRLTPSRLAARSRPRRLGGRRLVAAAARTRLHRGRISAGAASPSSTTAWRPCASTSHRPCSARSA